MQEFPLRSLFFQHKKNINIKEKKKLPCYNGRFANSRATEHNQTIAIAGWWFARVLLRGRGRGAGADRDRKDAILRAWGPLQLGARLCTPSPPVDSLLGLLCCASASAQPLRAAHESAARLQLKQKSLSININHASNFWSSSMCNLKICEIFQPRRIDFEAWKLGASFSFLIYLLSIDPSLYRWFSAQVSFLEKISVNINFVLNIHYFERRKKICVEKLRVKTWSDIFKQ